MIDDVLLEEDEELEVGTGDGDSDVEGRTGVIKNGFEPGLQRARAGEGGAARSVDDWRELIHPAPDAVSDLHETFQTIADDGDFFRELRGVEQLVQHAGQTEQPLQGVVHRDGVEVEHLGDLRGVERDGGGIEQIGPGDCEGAVAGEGSERCGKRQGRRKARIAGAVRAGEKHTHEAGDGGVPNLAAGDLAGRRRAVEGRVHELHANAAVHRSGAVGDVDIKEAEARSKVDVHRDGDASSDDGGIGSDDEEFPVGGVHAEGHVHVEIEVDGDVHRAVQREIGGAAEIQIDGKIANEALINVQRVADVGRTGGLGGIADADAGQAAQKGEQLVAVAEGRGGGAIWLGSERGGVGQGTLEEGVEVDEFSEALVEKRNLELEGIAAAEVVVGHGGEVANELVQSCAESVRRNLLKAGEVGQRTGVRGEGAGVGEVRPAHGQGLGGESGEG